MMRWKEEKIQNVVEIVSGGTPKSNIPEYWGGSVQWLTPRDMGKLKNEYVSNTNRTISEFGLSKSSAKLVPSNSIILSTRAPIGHLAINEVPMAFNQGCRGLVPNDNLDLRFLLYFLKGSIDLLNELGTGTTFRELSKKALSEVRISMPDLEEQKRIVFILDEAFLGIDKAIENTEKNYADANELFESYLNNIFSKDGKDWITGSLSNIAGKIKTGPFGSLLHKSDYIINGIPLINPAHILNGKIVPDSRKTVSEEAISLLKNYKLNRDDIVFGRRGEMGRCAVVTEKEVGWLCGTGCFFIRPFKSVHSEFLSILLRTPFYKKEIEKIASGATMLNLSNKALGNLSISIPSLEIQKQILNNVVSIENEQIRLLEIYERKLILLKELKRSLLQKAFSGELTTSEAIDTTTPEYTSQIIAFAYNRHQISESGNTFGHVKAQKILHLLEAEGVVDLGRLPYKDAAGPNDFVHMLLAEDWARKNDYFDFIQRPSGGYTFTKLPQFNNLLAEAKNVIENNKDKFLKIIDLLAPMRSLKAELFVTVHAAWNNLLLEGKKPTDEEIVLEARGNWHKDKEKIVEEKFYTALSLIRKKDMIPKGIGKPVLKRQENLI